MLAVRAASSSATLGVYRWVRLTCPAHGTPDARKRSAPGRRARPPGVDASGSEVSPGGFLQDRDVQSLVGDQPLQPLVFQIELFQATGLIDFHAAVR